MAGDGEFDFIRQRLQPLTEGDPAALDLADDAALLTPGAGEDLVLACDTLVAGVHFLETDTPQVVASRTLRTNLSDLAAMGAVPRAYLSAIAWPRELDADWRAAFTAALHREQAGFGLTLIGGDTTSTPGPLTISLTLVGTVPAGTALRRNGARIGDDVWISGVVGDAGLGLKAAGGAGGDLAACCAAYEAPEPRLALGQALRGFASAAIDVSDGLLADAGHVAMASRCAIRIDVDAVPHSPTAHAWLRDGGQVETLLTSGDDYELLFTASSDDSAALTALGGRLGLSLTRIGAVRDGAGVVAETADGRRLEPQTAGFTHF
ncbi:thiamine-phosphate kinase [Maricaulis maris]|uniref:Thiamine-monophosphate kinase n=1 Tax=Maricaulis maris TaxID=74318 RepID=A0A495DJU0_9PROT|nr:thiamine-phosphate kinase [Maricaulis maris]RKR02881.1 thiamine-phosphate kinase [Maricaulis maris]